MGCHRCLKSGQACRASSRSGFLGGNRSAPNSCDREGASATGRKRLGSLMPRRLLTAWSAVNERNGERGGYKGTCEGGRARERA